MKKDVEKSFIHLGKQIDIIIRYHPSAKKMRLRIDTKTKKGLVVIPRYGTQKKALEFAQSNASWLLAKFDSLKPKIIIKNEEIIPLFGKNILIKYQNQLRGVTSIDNDELKVYGDEGMLRNNVIRFIKSEMEKYVKNMASKYAEILAVDYATIKIKDTSSRWGSCNSKNEISICWKLAFAPIPVLDYIVAHEIVHLEHFDHSPRFWKTVSTIFPEYKKAQNWLNKNSSIIQNIG